MAGSCTSQIFESSERDAAELVISWTGDANNGTLTNYELNVNQLGKLRGKKFSVLKTKPGAGNLAPAANYSVKLLDDLGVDIAGGAGANRSASAPEIAAATVSAAKMNVPFVYGTLAFNMSGSNVAGAQGSARFLFTKY